MISLSYQAGLSGVARYRLIFKVGIRRAEMGSVGGGGRYVLLFGRGWMECASWGARVLPGAPARYLIN